MDGVDALGSAGSHLIAVPVVSIVVATDRHDRGSGDAGAPRAGLGVGTGAQEKLLLRVPD